MSIDRGGPVVRIGRLASEKGRKRMAELSRVVVLGTIVIVIAIVATVATAVPTAQPSLATMVSAAAEAPAAPEPAAPEGQSYIGVKSCASCHFQQFMSWKKTKHAKSFQLLPEQYKTDAKCLKCHTTGYGEPSGFKDTESTPELAGNSCEMCHGPGSKHAETCKPFTTGKLDAAQEKIARDSIWKMLPKNVCVACHLTKGHKESETPKELLGK